jgi:hypothetical protein
MEIVRHASGKRTLRPAWLDTQYIARPDGEWREDTQSGPAWQLFCVRRETIFQVPGGALTG